MTPVVVVNLSTLQEVFYVGISPYEAVICARELFDKGNANTWTYPVISTEVYEADRTVACGDWCALKDS